MTGNGTLNRRSVIEKMIHDTFDGLEDNCFAVLGQEEKTMWEKPLIGIAAGDDSYYSFLKQHIGAFHWTPSEAFAQKYGEVPPASDLSVISMVFPQTMETKDMQRQSDVFPCDNWLVSRGEWEPLIRTFCQRLEHVFEEQGIRSVCPDLLSGMSWMRSDNLGHASTWSQRHTAYAAGLGTFGLSDGLITPKGIAVRFTSIILETDLPTDGIVCDDPYGWCSKCGACISRCPVRAISSDAGHDKEVCAAYEDHCIENLWPAHIERGNYIFGCGLCQAGVPCAHHPPKQGTISYRKIKPSDNPQLARLVRTSLMDHELDIPGTAYYDAQLDRLFEYYSAAPLKRSYIVAVNESDRVVGGIGIDVFDRLEGCGELQKLYVADDYKRQGIGRKLIEMIEEEARRLGYDKIYLETHSNLEAAQKLYESMGYISIERPEYFIHETMDLFLLKESIIDICQ